MPKKGLPKKTKLRPARDVISRLRWSSDEPLASDQVVFGYIDRINGTMEKALQDYTPISEGGDIPEHRILYFRRVRDDGSGDDNASLAHLPDDIIWDRAGRVDRIFCSGCQNGAMISKETIDEATAAIDNMARLEEEKAQRRELKARDRARRARAKAATRKAATTALEHSVDGAAEISSSRNRFRWKCIPWYYFDEISQQWKEGGRPGCNDHTNPRDQDVGVGGRSGRKARCADFSVLTWNVLSNIYPGIEDAADPNDSSGGHDSRWSMLAEAIREQSPDVISLQEATPDFAEQLLSTFDWIKSDYASSMSPDDKSPVDPIGQITLWRRELGECQLHACVDGSRWRVLSASFRFGLDDGVLVCVNVHLPSDKPGVRAGEKISRQLARRRELSSIVGHLQILESRLRKADPQTEFSHLIMGDFNCGDAELENGSFGGGYFKDIHDASSESSGYTFCPVTNPRAAKSSTSVAGSTNGRRIDRIYLNTAAELESVRVDVIRGTSNRVAAIPPSDHYGIVAKFRSRDSKRRNDLSTRRVSLYDPRGFNAWAANTPPSKDYMVAVILDSEKMERIKRCYDSDSSLLTPHITLLYGFSELHHGSLDLAVVAVKDSINSASLDQTETIAFSEESLDVFEHRSSATLVARPDINDDQNKWLMQLYHSLRSCFRLCDEQEMHSADGFIPHVSLGRFGFASVARNVASNHIGTISCLKIPVGSVDILERNDNGKFRSIASVPFANPPNYPSKGPSHIISDTGSSASAYFWEKSQIVLSIIARATRSASSSFDKMQITSEVLPYGSAALGCALPKMSDLDVVITLRDDSESASDLKAPGAIFLKRLMTCLGETNATKKIRLRSLRSGLSVLSIQIQSNLPSADILLCLLGKDGKPLNPESVDAFCSIQDNEFLINVINDIEAQEENISNSFSIKDLFCASLRLIKLWAFNRGVYGAKCGFLSGGAWAIFLADILRSKLVPGQSRKKATLVGANCLAEAAHYLTLSFFEEASRWPWPQPIELSTNEVGDQHIQMQPRLVVLSPSASSSSNLAKNSTQSSCLSTAAELRRASTLANGIMGNDMEQARVLALQRIIVPLGLREFVVSSPKIIALELLYDKKEPSSSQHLPEDIEAWGCGQFLCLLVNLEKKLNDVSSLRPYSRAFKIQSEWKVDTAKDQTNKNDMEGFVWIICLGSVLSKQEHETVKEVSSRIADSFGEGFNNQHLDLSVCVLSSGDVVERNLA